MTQEIAGMKVALNPQKKTLIKCINFPNPNAVHLYLGWGYIPMKPS